MKFCRQLWLLGPLLLASGCVGQGDVASSPFSVAGQKDLKLTLRMPWRTVAIGERIEVVVTAENTSDEPIELVSRSGASVHLRIWRYTGLAWQQVKRYPEATTMVTTVWSIDPGSQRRFVIPITVEPDWPTGEVVAMTAELDGRPDVVPRLTFHVFVPAEQTSR